MTASPTISLRAAGDADRPFLRTVFASTREEEMKLVPWTGEQKHAFLDMQFHAQDSDYRNRFPDASFDIITWNGEPVGRLYVHRGNREIRILDIAILPDHRGRGAGTLLLESIIAESEATGKTVSIHVEMQNPALRLYQRLGFRTTGETGFHFQMERAPHPNFTPP